MVLFQYLQNLLAFTVDSSVQRVYFDYKQDERKKFLGTVLIFMFACTIFWIVIALLAVDLITGYLGGSHDIYWITIVYSVLAVYVNFFSRICYNENLSTLIFKQGLFQTVINHGGAVLLLSFGKLGILGRQAALMIASAVSLLFFAGGLKKKGNLYVEWTFNTQIFNRIKYFALPAFCNTFLGASLSYVDRLFLQHFYGSKEVGTYALGMLIGQGLNMVVESVSNAVFPSVMRELDKDYEFGINKLKQLDICFCGFLLLFGTLAVFCSDWIILLFSNKNYQGAGQMLPFIILAYVMGGFYKNVVSVLSFHSVVWIFPFLSIITFGISAVLNVWLIPAYHATGAAFSFFLGAFANSFLIQVIGSKYYFHLKYLIPVYLLILCFASLLFLRYIGLFGG